MRLEVPRLNDAVSDFAAMFRMWDRSQKVSRGGIVLDFSKCNFLRHNGVAFLGGLIRDAHARGIEVAIDWETVRLPILNSLKANGFAGTFGDFAGPSKGNAIPFREDRHEDEAGIMDYLKEHWLGHKAVRVSTRLGNAIRGVVWEIFTNAFEHSRSPIGVFACGQLYPKKEQLCLCVIDFGEGIPARVSRYRKRPWDPPSESLRWAFRRGNTTERSPSKSRGMGLDLLKSFVTANDGQLSIYTGGARARITKGEESFEDMTDRFRGTIVDIRLKCDERLYVLASELSEEPYF